MAASAALYPTTLSVPASFGASFLGGSAAAASAASAASAGAAATGMGSIGLLSGLGALGPIGLGAMLAYSLFKKKHVPVVRKDAPVFNLQDDLRTQQDKMYSPMFASGFGSTSTNPQMAYSVKPQINTMQNYVMGMQNLGMSGFGKIKGFGGYGGYVNKEVVPQSVSTNWTGFSTPLTNYDRQGIMGIKSVDNKGMDYNKRAPLLQQSLAGYQLRT